MKVSVEDQLESVPGHLLQLGCGVVADMISSLQDLDRENFNVTLRNDNITLFAPRDADLAEILAPMELTPELVLKMDVHDVLMNFMARTADFTSKSTTIELLGGKRVKKTKKPDYDMIDGLEIIEKTKPIAIGRYNLTVVIIYGILLDNDHSQQLLSMKPIDPKEIMSVEEATHLLQGLVDRTLDLATTEARNYGEETPLFRELDRMYRDLNGENNPLAVFFMRSRVSAKDLRKTRLVEYLDDYNQKLDSIVKRQHTLGRRCINKTDFQDAGSVFEARDAKSELDLVKPEDFIRLKSGVCWNIHSLLSFIEFQEGRNSIIDIDTGKKRPGFEGYPNVTTIWSDRNELERILDHPVAVESNFRADYFKMINKDYGNIGDLVSIETLDLMERTGRLLAGEGPEFLEELDKLLDKHQKEAWRAAKHDIARVQDKKLQGEICVSIVTTLKSNTLTAWRAHWNTLSRETQHVFDTVKPNFSRDMEECIQGRLCVFVSTNILFNARNAVARLKKLPEVRRFSEGLEPAAVCKGISERVQSRADIAEQAELNDVQRRFAGPRSPPRGPAIRIDERGILMFDPRGGPEQMIPVFIFLDAGRLENVHTGERLGLMIDIEQLLDLFMSESLRLRPEQRFSPERRSPQRRARPPQ